MFSICWLYVAGERGKLRVLSEEFTFFLVIVQGSDYCLRCIRTFQSEYKNITYEIVGDDAAPTYFSIDATKGDIRIKRDIKTDTETDYQVRTLQRFSHSHIIYKT